MQQYPMGHREFDPDGQLGRMFPICIGDVEKFEAETCSDISGAEAEVFFEQRRHEFVCSRGDGGVDLCLDRWRRTTCSVAGVVELRDEVGGKVLTVQVVGVALVEQVEPAEVEDQLGEPVGAQPPCTDVVVDLTEQVFDDFDVRDCPVRVACGSPTDGNYLCQQFAATHHGKVRPDSGGIKYPDLRREP